MFNIKFFMFTLLINLALSCGIPQAQTERDMLIGLNNAFKFLSDHHHELHVMIGEEEGNFNKAYDAFSQSINHNSNPKLLPVRQLLLRMKNFEKGSEDVKNLDSLVDYYQAGLSMEIEAILKGYGYKDNIDMKTVLKIYDSLNQ